MTTTGKDNNQQAKAVSVDSQGCISCGACIAICSAVFKFDENSKSYAAKQPENQEEFNCAKEAEAACPVNVITVKEVPANNTDYKPNDNLNAA